MIGRMWHGWTDSGHANAYETLLRAEVLPEIGRIQGCRGAWVLRREHEERVEFITLILFESLDAVHAFAGNDYEAPVISPEARTLLVDFDATASHYDVVIAPDEFGAM